jgi:hypothetical protein
MVIPSAAPVKIRALKPTIAMNRFLRKPLTPVNGAIAAKHRLSAKTTSANGSSGHGGDVALDARLYTQTMSAPRDFCFRTRQP